MSNQPPLNPDALASLRLLADRATVEVRHAVIEPDILHKLLDLAAAQPVVNSVEERATQPVGTIARSAYGLAAVKSVNGWLVAGYSKEFRIIDLPFTVLYRPEVES